MSQNFPPGGPPQPPGGWAPSPFPQYPPGPGPVQQSGALPPPPQYPAQTPGGAGSHPGYGAPPPPYPFQAPMGPGGYGYPQPDAVCGYAPPPSEFGAPQPNVAPAGPAGAYAPPAVPAALGGKAFAPGQSWVKERLKGLAMAAGAILVVIINVALAFGSGHFYPKLLIIAGGLGLGGAWMIVWGDEYDDYTGQLVPWKRYGFYACIGVGILLGIGLSALFAL